MISYIYTLWIYIINRPLDVRNFSEVSVLRLGELLSQHLLHAFLLLQCSWASCLIYPDLILLNTSEDFGTVFSEGFRNLNNYIVTKSLDRLTVLSFSPIFKAFKNQLHDSPWLHKKPLWHSPQLRRHARCVGARNGRNESHHRHGSLASRAASASCKLMLMLAELAICNPDRSCSLFTECFTTHMHRRRTYIYLE